MSAAVQEFASGLSFPLDDFQEQGCEAIAAGLDAVSAIDDDRMLELLEPYAGQRQRIIRLVARRGVRPERRGPRMTVRDYREF